MSRVDFVHIGRHPRVYVGVFVALLILTVLTVSVSSIELAIPLTIAVALVIAVTKGSLVASFFMHLISEQPVIYGILLLTSVFLLALIFLPLLGLVDSIAPIR